MTGWGGPRRPWLRKEEPHNLPSRALPSSWSCIRGDASVGTALAGTRHISPAVSLLTCKEPQMAAGEPAAGQPGGPKKPKHLQRGQRSRAWGLFLLTRHSPTCPPQSGPERPELQILEPGGHLPLGPGPPAGGLPSSLPNSPGIRKLPLEQSTAPVRTCSWCAPGQALVPSSQLLPSSLMPASRSPVANLLVPPYVPQLGPFLSK